MAMPTVVSDALTRPTGRLPAPKSVPLAESRWNSILALRISPRLPSLLSVAVPDSAIVAVYDDELAVEKYVPPE